MYADKPLVIRIMPEHDYFHFNSEKHNCQIDSTFAGIVCPKINDMLRNPKFAVVAGTFYLVVYCVVIQFDFLRGIGWMMLLLYPLQIAWIAITIFKHGKYQGPNLDKEEFGYQDKEKNELGIF